MELTQGQQGSRVSASLGVPTEMAMTSTVMSTVSSTVTSTGSTTTMEMAMVSSTIEIEQEVDLEAAMHSQGNDDDDTYGRKYKTTSEDRTDRGVARAKQREECERQERECKAMEYAERQLQKQVEEREKRVSEQTLLEQDEKVDSSAETVICHDQRKLARSWSENLINHALCTFY